MLTPRQIELIKATVPVLREHGVALTSHFYRRSPARYSPTRKTLKTRAFSSAP